MRLFWFSSLFFLCELSAINYNEVCPKSHHYKIERCESVVQKLKTAVEEKVRRASLFQPNSREFFEAVGEIRGIYFAIKMLHANQCSAYFVEIEVVDDE